MKKTIAILSIALAACSVRALDFTYSTNLFSSLSYPTNWYIGTNGSDTNGDTFHVIACKLNNDILLLQLWHSNDWYDIHSPDKTNTGTSYVPTNKAPTSTVWFPLALGSTNFTAPNQRGLFTVNYCTTNSAEFWVSNITGHTAFLLGGQTALGTNWSLATWVTEPNENWCLTNAQPGGVLLGTNRWDGL